MANKKFTIVVGGDNTWDTISLLSKNFDKKLSDINAQVVIGIKHEFEILTDSSIKQESLKKDILTFMEKFNIKA